MTICLDTLLNGLPNDVHVSAEDVRIAREKGGDNIIFVVLDDDPTGTQSVSNLPVLTHWDEADFRWAFSTGMSAVYVMTNSRSLHPDEAKRVNEEVVFNALAAADEANISFVSRSDSTLRGLSH